MRKLYLIEDDIKKTLCVELENGEVYEASPGFTNRFYSKNILEFVVPSEEAKIIKKNGGGCLGKLGDLGYRRMDLEKSIQDK